MPFFGYIEITSGPTKFMLLFFHMLINWSKSMCYYKKETNNIVTLKK